MPQDRARKDRKINRSRDGFWSMRDSEHFFFELVFHHPIVRLEAELADLHGKPAALAFTSGWISNLAGISMIEGVRRAGGEKKVWRHNDVARLEDLLAAEPLERAKLV